MGCAAFLDCSSDDADISYTLDGSDPRDSDNSQVNFCCDVNERECAMFLPRSTIPTVESFSAILVP